MVAYASLRVLPIPPADGRALVEFSSGRARWMTGWLQQLFPSADDELRFSHQAQLGSTTVEFQGEAVETDGPFTVRARGAQAALVITVEISPRDDGAAVELRIDIDEPKSSPDAITPHLRPAMELNMDRLQAVADGDDPSRVQPEPTLEELQAAHAQLQAVAPRTFAELGIPFPLFEARVGDCSRYAGPGTCAVLGSRTEHCFEVDAIRKPCSRCSAAVFQTAQEGRCGACGERIRPRRGRRRPRVSHQALRDGAAAFIMDTELGLVTPDLAQQGRTHGVPKGTDVEGAAGLTQIPLPVDPAFPDEPWVAFSVAAPSLVELTRTPPYHSWQGTLWLFHCARPMVFIGAQQRGELAFRCAACGVQRTQQDRS